MREMKESNVYYLKKIPKTWSIQKFKNFSQCRMGETILSEETAKDGIPVYSATQEDKIFGYTSNVKFILNKGDIVIPARGNSIGCATLVKEDKATCTQTTIGCYNIKYIDNKFYYYVIIGLKDEWFKYDGSAIPQITVEQVKNNKLAIPTMKEQKKIVDFLDKKIIEIDNVIEKTKETIEDYKIYKQSIITKAVTKGLDENVEMKETGSEWIGKIPAHWNYLRINRLFDYIDERNTDENAELLSLYTAIGVKPRSELEEKGNKAITVMNYKIVKENDIIVNKLLAWMGAIAYSNYNGVTSPDYDVYRAKKNINVVKEYYNAYFRYTCFKGDCYKYGHGIMMMRWRTYPEEFLRIEVPNPPYEEQIKIAEYLNKKCTVIDNLISSKEKLIEELESYKKSLIYEYVTGKKEVN